MQADGWCDVVLPISKAHCTKGGEHLKQPPPPGAGYCVAGKAAIEVCTHLLWKAAEDGDVFLKARFEHHLPSRVAKAGWWLKKKQAWLKFEKKGKKPWIKGYAAEDPTSVEVQATAAKGWMLATAELMVDSGWALAMTTAKLARVKLMGFETNNPLHEDHEGKGAHWHPTVRHIAKPRFASVRNPTPHLYFVHPDGASPGSGRMEVSGGRYSKQRPAVLSPTHGSNPKVESTEDVEGIARLEAFAVFLETAGSLTMAPLIALQSARAANAGLAESCLHVRKGWDALPKGEQFQLHGDDNSKSNWGIHFLPLVGANVVALRSAFCGGYFHARSTAKTLQQEADGDNGTKKWAVFMLHRDKESPGSQWIIKRDPADPSMCSLESVAFPGTFLHVRKSLEKVVAEGRKEQVLVLSTDATSEGSRWQMQAAHPDLLPTFRHSYEVAWTAGPRGLPTACRMVVERDGVPWRFVDVDVNSEAGAIVTSVRHAGGGGAHLAKPPLRMSFDPLTGNVRGGEDGIGERRLYFVPEEWHV